MYCRHLQLYQASTLHLRGYFTLLANLFPYSIYGPGQFMNPGPAPRPPVDRPRLNLTPSSTLPGNFSQMSLSSPSVRSFNTFPTLNGSSTSLSRTTSLDGQGGVAVIKEGEIKCKENADSIFNSITNWKTKYVVLRATQLDIHKGPTGKVQVSINLRDVTSVGRHDNIALCLEILRVANPGTNSGLANRDLPQKSLLMRFETSEELYDWQDSIYTRCPSISGVSNPTNFSHRVHVGFDPQNGNFVGLPPEWEKLLTASAITRDDYKKNPQAVIEVLEFYSDINKRNANLEEYPSLMPTPPAHGNQNKQLGHGGGGTSIAPPRPPPPGSLPRQASYQYQPRPGQETPPRSQNNTPIETYRKPSMPETRYEKSQAFSQVDANPSKLRMDDNMRRAMEEEARVVKEKQQQRQQEQQEQRERQERQRVHEENEQFRKEAEAYNSQLPKKVTPTVKQELGGYGLASDNQTRYNPTRVAPAAPGPNGPRQQYPSSSRQVEQRTQSPAQNGSVGGQTAAPRAPYAQTQSSSREQSPSSNNQGSLRAPARSDTQQQRQPSPATRQPARADGRSEERGQAAQTRVPANGGGYAVNGTSQHTQPPSRLPGPVQSVKPLNVAPKQAAGTAPQTATQGQKTVPLAVKQAEMALTQKSPAEARQKEVRMSSMSENEVMEKLKQIVTKQDPALSYAKQKKIGQGASGSVYVAKILEDAKSPIAQAAYKAHGPQGRVAIKTMDLRNQPRKELIVNEIIVMKESMHQNIVNYLDAFLLDGQNELWVVMEYMDAGALTDIIEANPVITEDQIAAICREVSHYCSLSSKTGF